MSGDYTKNTQGARCHAATKENATVIYVQMLIDIFCINKHRTIVI